MRASSEESGLSLLETVVSGFVLTLVIIFVTSLFPSSLLTIKGSESRLQADALATRLLEELRHRPFEDRSPIPPGEVRYDRYKFQHETRVEDVAGSDPRFLKRLRVTVTWQEREKDHKLERETWVHALRR